MTIRNALFTIHPYRDLARTLWVFDDAERGLVKEPFVPVTGLVIDALLAHLGFEADAFSLLFGAGEFPGWQIKLTRIDAPPDGGSWYEAEIRGLAGKLELWLCPALLAYFPSGAPEVLFAQIVAPERWAYADGEDDEILEAE